MKSNNQKDQNSEIELEDDTDVQRNRRTKERTIKEIIEKVSTWRKLYNGVMIPVKGPDNTK